jgi:L-threonylcarbamoyladenylate synthase
VIAAVGIPLTATSLNRSGESVVAVDEDGLRGLDWPAGIDVHVVVAPGARRFETASALVRVTGPEPEVLRAGPIPFEQIRAALTSPA